MSIIELLVSVAVIGIAVAGITELTWLNATWYTKSFNKIDNYFAAQVFLQRVSRDLRMAKSVTRVNPGTPGALDGIMITTTELASDFDANGFPVGLETIQYYLIADPANPGQYQMCYQPPQQQSGYVVLTGIIGPTPTNPVSSTPKIFQFVSKNTTDAISTAGVQPAPDAPLTVPSNVGAVIINLELRRQTFGLSNVSEADPKSPSVIAVRTEVTLRNAMFPL